MSILIRGVVAPKSCFDCKYITLFGKSGENRCGLLSWAVIEDGAHSRLSDCPIKELPPHGRLIDADALDADLERQDMKTGEWDAIGFSIAEVENAPTIIEAEVSE